MARLVVLADTWPLYAAIDPDDQYHTRARQDIASINEANASLVVAYPILAEAYTLVLKRLGPRRAVRFGRELLAGAQLLNPSPDDYRQALARLHTHGDLPLSLFDGVAAVLAERLNAAVWTYDRHFHAVGAQVWRAAE